MSLGEKIKGRREELGLSVEQLGEKLAVSQELIIKWESGKCIPHLSHLITISDELGLTLDELVKEDDAVKKHVLSSGMREKWHVVILIYLLAIVAYIGYFAIHNHIFMVGFLVATLFMLSFELKCFITRRISRHDQKE